MVKLFVKEPALIPIVGLSHNIERGGESVLSVFTLNYTKSTIKKHILSWKPQKRKPPTKNSLIK